MRFMIIFIVKIKLENWCRIWKQAGKDSVVKILKKFYTLRLL